MVRLRPATLLIATLFLSILAGIIVYSYYPLAPEEGLGVAVLAAGARDDTPGFVVATVGVVVLEGPVVVEGTMTGHVMLVVDGSMVPVIKVEANGVNYTVILGRENLEALIGGGGEIVSMPGMMQGMPVKVEGYMVEGYNIIVAEHIEMQCPHMGGVCHMGHMP